MRSPIWRSRPTAGRTTEPVLARALKACAGGKAQLLHIDFVLEAGWRQHPFLMRLMQQAPVSCLGLEPEPMMMDGKLFDPIAHFKRHRAAAAEGAPPTTGAAGWSKP